MIDDDRLKTQRLKKRGTLIAVGAPGFDSASHGGRVILMRGRALGVGCVILCLESTVGLASAQDRAAATTKGEEGRTGQVESATVEGDEHGFVEVESATVEAPPAASLAAPLPRPAVSAVGGAASAKMNGHGAPDGQVAIHREVPRDPWRPRSDTPPPGAVAHAGPWVRDGYVSVQVNVDADGNNIVGDAANETSIAIDPTNPNNIVIGWRQFDSVQSNFRQAGYAYSHNGGVTWTFPGVLEPGVFGSDPVLGSDGEGNFYYYSLQPDRGPGYWACYLYKSFDAGVTWPHEVYAYGGDKAWMAIDQTFAIGRGNIYVTWAGGYFIRSVDGGLRYDQPILIPGDPSLGTLAIAPDGSLYVGGVGGVLAKSTNAKDPAAETRFDWSKTVDLGGYDGLHGGEPNPGGLLGQVWVATPSPGGPNPNHAYLLATVRPTSGGDPADIMFARSTDGGSNWDEPVRINDDPRGNGAWQWFGTMSIAPTTGRIDVVWNDTRNTGAANLSELYYAYSFDGGVTWSTNIPVSPVFNSHIGWPQQYKLGDYYHTASDATGVNIAYAATFNGEQDVYFLRIDNRDCNNNGFPDADDIAEHRSYDCNSNGIPDDCEADCNGNHVADTCDLTNKVSADCDGNLVPDECERDFDHDDLIDECDEDIDNDGVSNGADVCVRTVVGTPIQPDGRPKSDTNQNCLVDLSDYWRFRNCLVNGRLGFPAPAEACHSFFDYDSDGNVNLRDFAGFQNAFGGSGP